MFIIWDKLFGTFAEEDEEPLYGLTQPLDSHSFLWQHFHGLLEVLVAAGRAKGWSAKVKVLFGRPDTIDPSIQQDLENQWLVRNSDERQPELHKRQFFRRYVVAQMIVTLGVLFSFLLLEHYVPVYLQVLTAAFILLTLINCGALLEQRGWVLYLEITRVGYFGWHCMLRSATPCLSCWAISEPCRFGRISPCFRNDIFN